jgi:hypothetical protein
VEGTSVKRFRWMMRHLAGRNLPDVRHETGNSSEMACTPNSICIQTGSPQFGNNALKLTYPKLEFPNTE